MNNYFKRALKSFSLDIAFDLTLLKYKARPGVLLYEVKPQNILKFDNSLHVMQVGFWTYVSLQKIDVNVLSTYNTGVFLGYLTPLISLLDKDKLNCTHTLDMIVEYKDQSCPFSSQIINIKDFDLKFHKVFNPIKKIAKRINCKVKYELEPYILSSITSQKILDKDFEWIKANEFEIINIIWNTGFEKTTDFFKCKFNQIENYIDYVIELTNFSNSLVPMTESQFERSQEIINECDLNTIEAIENNDMQRLKQIITKFNNYSYLGVKE